MVIKLFMLLIFTISCGRQVNLQENKLESTQLVTEAEKRKYQKAGTLFTSDKAIVFEGRTYKISVYSSNATTQFVKNQLPGTQIPVLFTGGINGNEVVIETIQRQ